MVVFVVDRRSFIDVVVDKSQLSRHRRTTTRTTTTIDRRRKKKKKVVRLRIWICGKGAVTDHPRGVVCSADPKRLANFPFLRKGRQVLGATTTASANNTILERQSSFSEVALPCWNKSATGFGLDWHYYSTLAYLYYYYATD